MPPDGLVEVKLTSAWASGMPRYVAWQVQQQLWLTGRAYALVAVLTGSMLELTTVERDPDMIAQLESAVAAFDRDHIRPRIRPERPPFVFTSKPRSK